MNSRERIFLTLKRKKLADKIPWTFNLGAIQGINPGLLQRYKQYMNISKPLSEYFNYDIATVLDPDVKEVSNAQFSGVAVGVVNFISNGINKEDYFDLEKIPVEGFLDQWGIYHHLWPIDPTFEVSYPPLDNIFDIKVIEEYPSPTIDSKSLEEAKIDVDKIKSKQKVSVFYSGSIYEWSKYLRGTERLMLDLYEYPEIVRAIVEKFHNFTLKLATSLQEIGVDILCFCDDFGTQNGLQISPAHWREFIKPAWKNIWTKVREKNKETIIFLHSCGKIDEIITDLIEIGLDVLHPIQPEAMNVYELSKKYQDSLAFWGTVSSQKTIPFGSTIDIDREIRERIEKLGSKGAFVVSPSNIMGPEVPLENINAFCEACKKYC